MIEIMWTLGEYLCYYRMQPKAGHVNNPSYKYAPPAILNEF